MNAGEQSKTCTKPKQHSVFNKTTYHKVGFEVMSSDIVKILLILRMIQFNVKKKSISGIYHECNATKAGPCYCYYTHKTAYTVHVRNLTWLLFTHNLLLLLQYTEELRELQVIGQ